MAAHIHSWPHTGAPALLHARFLVSGHQCLLLDSEVILLGRDEELEGMVVVVLHLPQALPAAQLQVCDFQFHRFLQFLILLF